MTSFRLTSLDLQHLNVNPNPESVVVRVKIVHVDWLRGEHITKSMGSDIEALMIFLASLPKIKLNVLAQTLLYKPSKTSPQALRRSLRSQ